MFDWFTAYEWLGMLSATVAYIGAACNFKRWSERIS